MMCSEFGREMRRLRRSHPDFPTMKELADELHVSAAYISAIERGERNPPGRGVIEKTLTFLGAEDRLEEFLELAAQSRSSVTIPMENKPDSHKLTLLALARRASDDADESFWAKLEELVN